jgi:hypothetical protein
VRRLGSAVGIVLFLATPSSAYAYCRTASCPMSQVGARCTPPLLDDCGIPLFWPQACIGFSVQKDGAPNIPATTVASIAKLAFSAWTSADCGQGVHPDINVSDLGFVTCDQAEYDPNGANSNTILFRANGWPYTMTNALALTTVTYNLDTGEIRDADMELNATDVTFSTGDTNVTYDLQSIMTHEAGHFLGLAHSQDPNATMRPGYPPHSTALRELDPDDVAAICNAYPLKAPMGCDPTPHGGLADACNTPAVPAPKTGCCAIAVGAGTTGPEAVLALAGGVALVIARRVRRTRGPARGELPRRRGASDRCPRPGSVS